MVLVFKQYVSNVFTHVYTVSILILLTNHMLDADYYLYCFTCIYHWYDFSSVCQAM